MGPSTPSMQGEKPWGGGCWPEHQGWDGPGAGLKVTTNVHKQLALGRGLGRKSGRPRASEGGEPQGTPGWGRAGLARGWKARPGWPLPPSLGR